MCPNNCSGRGECHVGNSTASVYCECEANWKGPACDVPYCLADCGFPERGRCEDKMCLCESGWQGGPLSSDCHGGNVGLARAGLHTHTHSDSKKLLAGCLYRHRELSQETGTLASHLQPLPKIITSSMRHQGCSSRSVQRSPQSADGGSERKISHDAHPTFVCLSGQGEILNNLR